MQHCPDGEDHDERGQRRPQRPALEGPHEDVGQQDRLPDDGSGCYPSVPFAAKDFPYLRDTGKRLNLMLRLVAAWNKAQYVDTYGPTIGHDMCKAPADRWIEPLQPTSPAAPAHPNAKGEEAMARAVLERLAKGRGRD